MIRITFADESEDRTFEDAAGDGLIYYAARVTESGALCIYRIEQTPTEPTETLIEAYTRWLKVVVN